VRILAELSERPRSVGELAAAVEMEQSAVSHQLRLLRHLGLVVGERQGKRIVYALHDSHVAVLLAEAT
jgi:ArsR family transcriptional regulator, nickel/cobalt-responsive transcriptional repressor